VNASSLSADDKANVNYELKIKLAQFNTALAEALGLQVNALMVPRTGQQQSGFSIGSDETPTSVTPSEEFDVRVHVTSAEPWTTGGPLKLTKTWLESRDKTPWKTQRLGAPGLDTPSSNAGDAMYRVTVPRDAAYTRPYFTRPSPEQPYYDISDPKLLNLPLAPYPLAGWAEFSYDGVPLQVGQVVQTNHR
jgi:hypothetical protein